MQEDQRQLKVLICNRYAIFREGIKLLIENCESMEIVGETSTAGEAIEKLPQLRPDVVLLDLAMSDLSGSEATRRIKNFDPGVVVLVLSLHDDAALVSRCMEAGADGYVHKDRPALFLESAIRAACRHRERTPARTAANAPSISEVHVRARLHRAS